MQENITMFTGLGVCGVIAWKLGTVFLEEKKQDKLDGIRDREAFLQELKEVRKDYKQEQEKDRLTYTTSINSVVDGMKDIANRMALVEDDVKEIKNQLNK